MKFDTVSAPLSEQAQRAVNQETKLLFVYGTLKRGFSNHRLLEECKFVEEGCMSGVMYSLGGFPGMVVSDGLCDTVHGEVYEVTDFTRLDQLEGYYAHAPERSLYLRDKQPYFSTRKDKNGFSFISIRESIYVYIFNRSTEGLELIKDGVWRHR